MFSAVCVFWAFAVTTVKSNRSTVLKFFIVIVFMYLLMTLVSVVHISNTTDHAKTQKIP